MIQIIEVICTVIATVSTALMAFLKALDAYERRHRDKPRRAE